MLPLRFGPQTCTDLATSSQREWLVTDGQGGFALGTVSGLRTRRYHGLLIVATQPPIGRHLALASLDAAIVVGDRRHRLATHEWASGALDPQGFVDLASFELREGVPTWRWSLGDVVIEREVAMVHGQPAVGVVHRVVRAPGPVRIELSALCTWRDVHGERFAWGDPSVERTADGFVFEQAYRVRGPGFEPTGEWYRNVFHREEAARGLNAIEDLWFAGRFAADIAPGAAMSVEAWAGEANVAPAEAIVNDARDRTRSIVARCSPADDVDRSLTHAADQFIVTGPTVVAGYPWFGDWSRDTMTSYEGLFLETGRADEGRELLLHAAAAISEGMLANTADVGGTEYNTVDAAMWFLHAATRHVERTGDVDLGSQLEPALAGIVHHHVAGTRFGIKVDDQDGLLAQGADGWALTWMDARIDGVPVTARQGKPVEVNALWCNGLAALASLQDSLGLDASETRSRADRAKASFVSRFSQGTGLYDVIDSPDGDDAAVRPNQLLATSLPHGPFVSRRIVEACGPLLTAIGLRSLAPDDSRYLPRHRGDSASRDRAYHQGTVWPWLIGPYVEAALRTGAPVDGLLDGLVDHLSDFGLGSISETADGDAPHGGTGCPFQAWSVAEVFRARRLLARR
jgi:predicted glycogen debranching enzyme